MAGVGLRYVMSFAMRLSSPTIAAAWRARPEWQRVLLLAMGTVFYVQICALVGTKVLVPEIGWSGGIRAVGNRYDHLEGRMARYDSGFYLYIADVGYEVEGRERAFFPLYPLAMRGLSRVTGLSLPWSGLLISLVSFLAACVVLHRWVLLDSDARTAFWSVAWLCAFPMAFFFTAVYAEALFLLLSVATVSLARRGRWLGSGLAIALAGATRPTAPLLAFPYVVEFLAQRRFGRRRMLRFALGAAVAPLGMLSYWVFLASSAGNAGPLDIYTVSWDASRTFAWPWVTVYDAIRAALFGTGINSDWFSRTLAWQDLGYVVLAGACSVWASFRLRASVSSFLVAGVLLVCVSHGPYGYAFWSSPRYVACLFPVYVVLAHWSLGLPRRLRLTLILASLALLGLLSAWFASGRWVA